MTWEQALDVLKTVGLPTGLLLLVLYGIWKAILAPISKHFLGENGLAAKWLQEAIASQQTSRESMAKLTEQSEKHTETQGKQTEILSSMNDKLTSHDEHLKDIRSKLDRFNPSPSSSHAKDGG